MIETKNDWWQIVDYNWADLLNILRRFLPLHNHEIIASGEVVPSEQTMLEEINRLKESRDRLLCRYFFAAWDKAPECSGVHSIHGWSMLCNLLAVEYVLDDDTEVLG
jgi:hypothetical protein